MKGLITLSLLGVALVVGAQPVEALVMCGPKTKTGALREGASIKVRTSCRDNEIQLDTTALGLQGPPGSGILVRDGQGTSVGALYLDGSVVIADAVVDGRPVLVTTAFSRGGLLATAGLEFESSDCSGPPLFGNRDFSGALTVPIAIFGPAGPSAHLTGEGTTGYYPYGDQTMRTIRSAASFNQGCGNVPGQFPIAAYPNGCCEAFSSPIGPVSSYPTTSRDLSTLVPEFRLDAAP